jgi:hypothetical protein
MHNGVDFVLEEDFFDLCADAQIGFTEDRFGRDGGGVAFLQIVEGDDPVAAGKEDLRTDAADVACCSGYENVQRMASLLRAEWDVVRANIKNAERSGSEEESKD